MGNLNDVHFTQQTKVEHWLESKDFFHSSCNKCIIMRIQTIFFTRNGQFPCSTQRLGNLVTHRPSGYQSPPNPWRPWHEAKPMSLLELHHRSGYPCLTQFSTYQSYLGHSQRVNVQSMLDFVNSILIGGYQLSKGRIGSMRSSPRCGQQCVG